MKNHFSLLLLSAVLLAHTSRAQIGVGTTTPNAKSALDIQSADKGLLIPRLTAAQRLAIATPPQGLMVYQTDGTTSGGSQTGFWYYAGAPAAWVFLSPAADNLGNHTATQNLQLGTNQLVGNGGTQGLSVLSNGDARLGKVSSWVSTADDQVLHFGDNSFVTVGEAGGDDRMVLKAKTFALMPSSTATAYTGAVGIGTASPASMLHIYSDDNPTVLRLHSSVGFGSVGLDFYSDPQGSASEWRPAFLRSIDAGSFTGGMAFYTNGTGSANRTGSVEGMRLVNGRLGIGTTTPDSRLDVDGTITVSGANTNEVNRAQTGTANLLPICYGNINADATINTTGSTTNFTVTKSGVGVYDVTITGESYFYPDYTTVASLNGTGGELMTNSIGATQLRVFTFNSAGAVADRPFNFVTYKP
jgi:hypothetical protein